jgi:hypothetical protein
MAKNKKIYRFNVDTSNSLLPGSTTTNPKWLLKIPATVKKGRIFVEWMFIDPSAANLAANYTDFSGIVVRSSSFGTHEYSDSSTYGVIYGVQNLQSLSPALGNRHNYIHNKINISDFGYQMNTNLNLSGLVVELQFTAPVGTLLTSTDWERFRVGFLIVDDDERV